MTLVLVGLLFGMVVMLWAAIIDVLRADHRRRRPGRFAGERRPPQAVEREEPIHAAARAADLDAG